MVIRVGKAVVSPKFRPRQMLNAASRAASTEAQYGKIIRRFMLQLERANEEPTVENIVLLLERNSAKKSGATVRLYRSAVILHIERLKADGLMSQVDADTAIRLLKLIKGRQQSTPRSSAMKAKFARENSVNRLINKLDGSRSTVARLAKLLFLSSVMLGLRPSEWFAARREGKDLTVRNSKSTNGRATGEYRIIDLSNPVLMLDAQKIDTVDQTLSAIERAKLAAAQSGKSIEQIIEDVQQLIRRCRITSGNRSVTIYTARHQFSANMKKAGLSKRQIADLMGHASPETAGAHYGRKVSGYKAFQPRRGPAPDQDMETSA